MTGPHLRPAEDRPSPGVHRWRPTGPCRGSIGLLHGVMSWSGTWWRTGPALASLGWETSAVDLAGHGSGPRVQGGEDPIGTLVDGAKAALPAPLTVLAGHSLGAVVAMALSARDPAVAAGLVLEEPPGRSDQDDASLAASIDALGHAVKLDREGIWRQVRGENPRWEKEDVDQAVAAIEAADTAQIAGALRHGRTWDLAALFGAVQVPVLVIASSELGRPFSEGGSALRGADREAVRSLVPNERFVELDGGHSLHREQSQRVTQLISDFAAGLAS